MSKVNTKTPKLYNGLEKDFKTFSKFVFIYEEKISSFTKNDDFKSFSKKAMEVYNKYLGKKIVIKTIKEIEQANSDSKHTLFIAKRNVKLLDFCRHLRNSFCHAILKVQNGEIDIPDKGRGGLTSSKGTLNYTSVLEFVNEIINDYENKAKTTLVQTK